MLLYRMLFRIHVSYRFFLKHILNLLDNQTFRILWDLIKKTQTFYHLVQEKNAEPRFVTEILEMNLSVIVKLLFLQFKWPIFFENVVSTLACYKRWSIGLVFWEVTLYLSTFYYHWLEKLDQAWLWSFELQRFADFSIILEHLLIHAKNLYMELSVFSIEQVKSIIIYYFFSTF